METWSRGVVCGICEKPLLYAWRTGEPLCGDCGLSDELFHPHKRWITAEGDARPAPRIAQQNAKNGGVSARWIEQALLRLGLKILAMIAPAAAEKLGARIFFTPRRTSRWMPPGVSDLAATSFRFSLAREEIACWSWGRGPTVLLVHGWEGYAAQLIRFVQPLVDAGFRVVTFDMPAHGASTGRQLSAFDMADAIRAVSQLCAPIRGVIAHSLGGTASIIALGRGLPAERLVLLAPAAEPSHFARALARQLGFSSRRTAGMLKRIENRLGMSLEEASTLQIVPRMTAPVLLMHDPQDPEVPFEHGKRIADAWPGARLELLYQVGHRRMMRDPKVIDTVTSFIVDRDAEDARRTIASTGSRVVPPMTASPR